MSIKFLKFKFRERILCKNKSEIKSANFFFYSTLIPEIGFECLPGTHVLNRPSKQMQSTHKTELRALDTRLSACARSIIFHVNVLFQKRKKRI